MFYKIIFIKSAVFVASLLSNLVDNLAEGIRKNKCADCDSFPESDNINDNLINYKCLPCNKIYLNKIDENLENLKNRFSFF